jgi:selenocysteine lyase/cysteine desulfurase
MMNLNEFKKEFKDREGLQFNHARIAPISNRVALRANRILTQLNFLGSGIDETVLNELKTARENLAGYLNADVSEIAYFPNCASALSQIAFSMKLSAFDSVVTIDQEYASNFYPWKVACEKSGAKLIVVSSDDQARLSLEKVVQAIKPGVKCVSISWVQFQTGTILDLRALGNHCASVGAKLVVDGIQGIGQLPISFRDLPIDALIGGSHKWLCAINGQAFMAIKKTWLSELDPLMVGSGTFNRFGSYADPSSPMETSARKFEPGGVSFISLLGLDEAISLQREVGVQTIADEIKRLAKIFRTGLQKLETKGVKIATPFDQAGGVTSFQLSVESEAKLFKRCKEEQVTLSKSGDYVRVAIHAFNEESEITKLLELIERG